MTLAPDPGTYGTTAAGFVFFTGFFTYVSNHATQRAH
jgi:hypothetical protein